MATYVLRKELSKKAKEGLKVYDPLLQELLYSRGIDSKEAAQIFLEPDYERDIHNPFLMHGMKKSVTRILKAIKNKENIVIYSDYDCDGIPGGVVLHDFFKKIGYKHFSNYIPHRHEEGYGLNISAIEKAGKDGTKVLITVDCGITDAIPVKRANELGIDVIITDHHLEGKNLPKAYAILNPNQKADKTYPFKDLCGAGVAFKLVQGLIQKGDFNIIKGWEKWLLDMVGLSTVADMVPLKGENRTLAHYGLYVLRRSRRPGLQQLLRKIRVNQNTITEEDIGFMIGPRINAASRMDHPMDAFKLLSTDDPVEGGTLSIYLDKLNRERKGIVGAMTREVNARLKKLAKISDVIVMGNPDWRPALLGLVANSVVEEYERPVFLWGREGSDTYKGSCRSDGSINVVEFMGSIPDTFIDAGGHAFAGGFSVKNDKIFDFEKILNKAYAKFPKESVDKTVIIDKKMSIDEVNENVFRSIDKCAPFGVGNSKPLFLFEDVVIEKIILFGKDKNHLRLHFKNGSDKIISAIKFFATLDSFDKNLVEGEKVNLVASFEKSTFLNKTELRLRIVDIY